MSNVHVYSTLSSPQRYTKYAIGAGDMPREDKSVLIKGGANIADKNFITPRGVVTTITEEDYEFLKENSMFKTHVDNGYITVEKSNTSIDKVVADMVARDESAPMVPQDYEVDGKEAPTVKSTYTKRGKR